MLQSLLLQSARILPLMVICLNLSLPGITLYTWCFLHKQTQGNPRILSYVLDTKEHLSRPKESQISISAPLVSIAAFPSQLFLLLSSGEVQSLSLVNGIQPSSLPMPVLVQSQIAPPLATTAKDYNAKTAVPTVTPVDCESYGFIDTQHIKSGNVDSWSDQWCSSSLHRGPVELSSSQFGI